MECYCHLRNIRDLLSYGVKHLKGGLECHLADEVVPFGAMVENHPISAKDQSRLHLFGAKVLPGRFLGNALYAERIWKGDMIVADVEE